MFAASLLHLTVLAALLHLTKGDLWNDVAQMIIRTGAVLHLAFVAEAVFHLLAGNRMRAWHWWSVLLPPLRLGAPDHLDGKFLWLPVWHWQPVDRFLESRLRSFFSLPLMALAVLVLPLVIAELFWMETLLAHPAWLLAVEIMTAVIWMAFVIEFVLQLSTTKRKWGYAIRNWIDVVVILLPLLAFLRGARLARLIRMNQLTRTARVYRVRGLILRAWRALLALELVEKVLWRNKRALIARLEEQLMDRELEVQHLRKRIEHLRTQIHDQQAFSSKPADPAIGTGP
jgi:voltage-gated potassium channel